jgi:osmotically-inducible protein OsmY
MVLRILSSFRVNFLLWVVGSSLPALQGCTTFPKETLDRRAGAQVDDQVIESRAATHLRDGIRNGKRFTSYNRYVLLTEEVPNSSAKSRIAETIMGIENVQGVWSVIVITDNNCITTQIDDSLVASRVRARLDKANPLVANHARIVVDIGMVFFFGIVSIQEAQEAIQVARTTDGVRYVANVMKIFSDAKIQRIEAALRPSAPVATDCNCTVPTRTTSAAPSVRETG